MTKRRAWMTLPGLREGGDRTIKEQMIGLDRALAETNGKTVLDMGCAEAAIARNFALAGAISVLGMEVIEEHLKFARLHCVDVPQVTLVNIDFRSHLPREVKDNERYDIVLALAIIHKLHVPEVPLRFAAQSSKSLVVLRLPRWSRRGIVKSKQGFNPCNVFEVMAEEGFELEFETMGPHAEPMQYWRRK